MARVFSAVDIPGDVCDRLEQVQGRLNAGFNLVDPDLFHCTLQFFADIDDGQVAAVEQAMDAVTVEPFEAAVRGVGAFPSTDYIAVVWAGLEAPALARLHEQVTDHPVPDDDDHDFHPHVTLFRVDSVTPEAKQALQAEIAELADHRFGTFTVDHITLYESQLSGDGPTYTDLHRTEL